MKNIPVVCFQCRRIGHSDDCCRKPVDSPSDGRQSVGAEGEVDSGRKASVVQPATTVPDSERPSSPANPASPPGSLLECDGRQSPDQVGGRRDSADSVVFPPSETSLRSPALRRDGRSVERYDRRRSPKKRGSRSPPPKEHRQGESRSPSAYEEGRKHGVSPTRWVRSRPKERGQAKRNRSFASRRMGAVLNVVTADQGTLDRGAGALHLTNVGEEKAGESTAGRLMFEGE